MKLTILTDYMFEEISDKAREALIVELVLTAPDAQTFIDKAIKRLENLQKKGID